MRNLKTKQIARTGMLFALAIALSYLESLVPSIGVPGIKLGLSNIVTMYCLFFLGPAPALTVALLKGGFVFLMRGVTAGLLSTAGGVCSVGVMLLLRLWKTSKGLTSVAGAVTHNLAQIVVAALILHSVFTLYMAPLLVLSGIGMGVVTAMALRTILPALEKLELRAASPPARPFRHEKSGE